MGTGIIENVALSPMREDVGFKEIHSLPDSRSQGSISAEGMAWPEESGHKQSEEGVYVGGYPI